MSISKEHKNLKLTIKNMTDFLVTATYTFYKTENYQYVVDLMESVLCDKIALSSLN